MSHDDQHLKKHKQTVDPNFTIKMIFFVCILVDLISKRLCYVNDKLSVYFKLEDVMAIMIRLRGKSIR